MSARRFTLSPLGSAFVTLGEAHRVFLRARIDHDRLTFSHSLDGEGWSRVCDDLDAGILSDDHGRDWGFTGAFVGLACQDLTGSRIAADFDFFEYSEGDP